VTTTISGLATGDTIKYQITVTNNGNDTLNNVTIADADPVGTDNAVEVSETGPGDHCSIAANFITCTGITLAPGQSYSVVFRVTITAGCGATITNNAQADSDETSPTTTNTVVANLGGCVTPSPTPTAPPTEIPQVIVTVVVTNTPIPTVLVTQVAAIVVTPTRVAEVAGAASLPRSGGGPRSSTNQGVLFTGIVLLAAGGSLLFAGRRGQSAA